MGDTEMTLIAIGVSGALPEQDGVCVRAGIDALSGKKVRNR